MTTSVQIPVNSLHGQLITRSPPLTQSTRHTGIITQLVKLALLGLQTRTFVSLETTTTVSLERVYSQRKNTRRQPEGLTPINAGAHSNNT